MNTMFYATLEPSMPPQTEDDEARNGCVLVGNGTYSYTWTPQWLPGFQLNSGVYRVFVNIENPPNNSGKDYGSAAEASGVWFRLLPKY